MGLGKTVQSIAFLCHIAEKYGEFLSTFHKTKSTLPPLQCFFSCLESCSWSYVSCYYHGNRNKLHELLPIKGEEVSRNNADRFKRSVHDKHGLMEAFINCENVLIYILQKL